MIFLGVLVDGYQSWILKIPSIWGYQLIWWFLGIGLIWFLGKKMDLATLPKKPIQPNDIYEEADNLQVSSYTENVGSGYGWILSLGWLSDSFNSVLYLCCLII